MNVTKLMIILINTVEFVIKGQLNALGFTITIITTMSCYAGSTFNYDAQNIQIEMVNPVIIDSLSTFSKDDQAMLQACKDGQLSPQQVKKFFELSENYTYYPYNEYYQIPCKITGVLKSQGKIWQFAIDVGATGNWQSQQNRKYFGCRKSACESLVILPTDNMGP